MINISKNALPAHLAHGDIVPDADGDGYTKINPCGKGNQDDCNDNNPAINPGVPENCDNGIDDNCDGNINEGCISVRICNQVWMIKNLDVSTYRNGDPIPEVSNPAVWATLTTGAWCYYANNSANGPVYGKLYNWYAVKDPRGLSPAGWHIASDAEWNILIKCLDPSADTTVSSTQSLTAGGAMKEIGITHWNAPNAGATNSSGFTALGGGERDFTGTFNDLGYWGKWWSSTEFSTNSNQAWLRAMGHSGGFIQKLRDFKPSGFFVRCVRD